MQFCVYGTHGCFHMSEAQQNMIVFWNTYVGNGVLSFSTLHEMISFANEPSGNGICIAETKSFVCVKLYGDCDIVFNIPKVT